MGLASSGRVTGGSASPSGWLLGTSFGQPSTPAWVLDLEADPRATVTYRGTSLHVLARAATEPERAQVLAGSVGVYRGYVKYQQRIRGRALRIFVLEPRTGGP